MKKWNDGTLAGTKEGVFLRKDAQVADRARERQEAGKVPKAGPVTRRLTSRRKASIALAAGPLTNWIKNGDQNTTQG